MAIWNFLSGLVAPVTKMVDDLHTSAEERLAIKAELGRIQAEFATKALEYEGKLFSARAGIITTEAKSESWLTRNWRPMAMIDFLIILNWFVLGKVLKWPLPDEAFVLEVFALLKLGIGGYLIGRSAEKVASKVVGALKKKENV